MLELHRNEDLYCSITLVSTFQWTQKLGTQVQGCGAEKESRQQTDRWDKEQAEERGP